jgi:DNA-binding PucR family transcriptional regulator
LGSVETGGALAAVAGAVTRQAREGDLRLLSRADGGELVVVCDLALQGDARAEARAEVRAEARAAGGDGAASASEAAALAERAEQRLGELARQLYEAAAGLAPPGALSAGFSRPHPLLAMLPQAAAEARDALRIGRRVHGPGALVRYADLGLYRVLDALRESPELRAFYEQTLGALAEYDRRTGQNLIETLEVFFECHGNLSQTAVKLHHHRNSLLYRIGRIQEISGLSLEDPEARLSLQVALKARRLLS